MNINEKAIDRGYDAGDDNKLQKAMLENLEQTYKEQVEAGHEEAAQDVKKDIDALRAHMENDHENDPNDTTPDDLDVSDL
jgi:hypothetical protein